MRLSFFLAALLLHALASTRRIYIGIALGLLVANKLDGALAAVAYTSVVLVVQRRFPWKEAGYAALAAAPLALLLLWQFGSVIPNSAKTKLLTHTTLGGFDPLWMLADLWSKAPLTFTLSAASLMLLSIRAFRDVWPPEQLMLQAWLVLHVAMYSVIDMGDRYPWYAAVPIFLTVPIAAGTVQCMLTMLFGRRTGDPGPKVRRAVLQSAILVLPAISFLLALPHLRWRLTAPRDSLYLPDNGLEDLARLAAGAWLRKNSSGTELMCTPYGLPALGYRGPVLDYSGLNSVIDDLRALQAMYYVAPADTVLPEVIAGLPLQAAFQFGITGRRYLVLARPESEIVRNQLEHFLYPLDVMRCPEHRVGTGPPPHLVSPNKVSFEGARCLVLIYDREGAALTAELAFELSHAASNAQGNVIDLSIQAPGGAQYTKECPIGSPTPVSVAVNVSHAGSQEPSIHIEIAAEPEASTILSGLCLENIRLMSGHPLRPGDFPVMCRRWENRIVYVAEKGYPGEVP